MDLSLLLKVMKPVIADEALALMGLSMVSVILFCACCYLLMREALSPIPIVNQGPYSKRALRIGKAYKILAWAVMSAVFLMGLVISFIQVFSQLQ